MGRFQDPYHADLDAAGPCKGPNQGWDKPGQDWIQSNCPPGKPQIYFGNRVHGVFITLEPVFRQVGDNPFYLKLFWQPFIAGTCFQMDPYFINQSLSFPEMYIHIAL
jgi:hypothetical protein